MAAAWWVICPVLGKCNGAAPPGSSIFLSVQSISGAAILWQPQRNPDTTSAPASHTMRETFFSGGLRWLIKTTDALLRRIGGITEFETEVKGLLRIELSHATRTLTLPDGTRVQRGVPIMDLHFWNEHLPPFLSEVDNFDWASRVEQQIQTSLHRLVLFIHARQEPDKVQALRVTLSIAKHGPPSVLARLLMKAGFEPIESPTSGTVCFMPILEGIWAWLLTWTYNPRGLIDWRFNRTRREFWVSRQQLLARYARAIS
jgi:hypothetical protein